MRRFLIACAWIIGSLLFVLWLFGTDTHALAGWSFGVTARAFANSQREEG